MKQARYLQIFLELFAYIILNTFLKKLLTRFISAGFHPSMANFKW